MSAKNNIKTKDQKTTSAKTGKVAVLECGGRQYLVREGDELLVEKLENTKKSLIFVDILRGAKIKISVLEQTKAPKISIWKFKNKTGYLRRKGHRQKLSKIKVESIKQR